MRQGARSSLLIAIFIAPAMPATAQPVQVVHRFLESPAYPNGPLVQVPDGAFYGVTAAGIIRLSSGGQATEVARFDDASPEGALVLAQDGALYGAARSGWPAPFGRGSIFRFDPSTGALRTVHTFQSPEEGRDPFGGLVAVGTSLYGVTRNGPGPDENGTIFHVVLATGQVVTDHVFLPRPSPGPTLERPTGPRPATLWEPKPPPSFRNAARLATAPAGSDRCLSKPTSRSAPGRKPSSRQCFRGPCRRGSPSPESANSPTTLRCAPWK
jgi:uncharacterized repeat protein (TIGR03803 family)